MMKAPGLQKLDFPGRTKFIRIMREKELALNTITTHLWTLGAFFSRYNALTKDNLLAFKQWYGESFSAKSLDLRISGLNSYCKAMGLPELCLKRLKVPKRLFIENVIERAEFDRLTDELKKAKNWRCYFIVQFLAKTGARAAEFCGLQREGLVKGYFDIFNKGRMRRIHIPQNLIDESGEYFQTVKGDYLFPNSHGRKMTTRGLDSILKNLAEQFNIRKEVMHCHSFRHLFALEFLKRENNIALLATLMGHSNIETTGIYLKLSEAETNQRFNAAVNW